MQRPSTIILPEFDDEPIALVTLDGTTIASSPELLQDPHLLATRRELEAALRDDALADSLILGLTKP